MHKQADVYDFAGVGELAETTIQLLALGLMEQPRARRGSARPADDQVKHFVMQQARDYLAQVREGFVLSVRTADTGSRSELHYLLERVLTDWGQLSQELGLADAPSQAESTAGATEGDSQRIERVRCQLLAFGMAAVALGFLPRVPAEQVTFPFSYGKPATYADIPSPDTPGELLWRIEELEETVWQVTATDLQELVTRRYGSLRRTYGFFEASALLAGQQSERFGVKKTATLTLL